MPHRQVLYIYSLILAAIIEDTAANMLGYLECHKESKYGFAVILF